ncbi:MAG: GTP 3',8-cyclase MoaA [Gemmatimonadales bacterium]|nr:GTP 3',8-cyclase MoaA [Gemmatimonadales bacterium]
MIVDTLQRPLQSLRISVTDRCNLRCNYCMPEEHYTWLPRESLLTFEEIVRAAAAFVHAGVRKMRLTGGEPLLRRDIPALVRMLRAIDGIDEIALTTNGLLLAPVAHALRDAGLDRVTVSIDTLRPERMAAFARSARHADVVAGIVALRDAGFARTKLNAVVVRGYNDDELADLVRFAADHDAEMRFIEYMDVGGATQWRDDRVLTREEILKTLGEAFGTPATGRRRGDPHAPAESFVFPRIGTVGVIASTTTPFCRNCDRARLTADGTLFTCLYATGGHDLRAILRDASADQDALRNAIAAIWRARTDRGAEERLAEPDRQPLLELGDLRADPRREMHVRGG